MLDEDSAAHFLGNMPYINDKLDIEDLNGRLDWQIEVTKRAVSLCKEKKKMRSSKPLDNEAAVFTAEVNEIVSVIKEYEWLYEKFGEGEYKDILGLCKCVSREEIAEKGYSLTPGAYVGVAPVEDDGVDFAERMKEIHRELLSLQAESNSLMETISKNMEEFGGS